LGLPGEILPWMAYDVIRVALESSVRDAFKLRPLLCEWLDPKLAAFRRISEDWPQLPEKLARRITRQYEGSWYGRNCAPGEAQRIMVKPDWSDGYHPVKRSPWWSHWTAACYCEMLIREGYEMEAK
jgi:hypothetical protein